MMRKGPRVALLVPLKEREVGHPQELIVRGRTLLLKGLVLGGEALAQLQP